jgi:hypothetical protein
MSENFQGMGWKMMLKYYKNEKIHVIQMERQCRNQDELLNKGRANDPDLFGEGRGSFITNTKKLWRIRKTLPSCPVVRGNTSQIVPEV